MFESPPATSRITNGAQVQDEEQQKLELQDNEQLTVLCLSGDDIRSAAFYLGAAQAFAARVPGAKGLFWGVESLGGPARPHGVAELPSRGAGAHRVPIPARRSLRQTSYRLAVADSSRSTDTLPVRTAGLKSCTTRLNTTTQRPRCLALQDHSAK